MNKELLKGSINILLLSLIAKEARYGYQIVKILKENSGGAYQMSEGTLYPALKRLEKNKWAEAYWQETETGRRKYYRITDQGLAELDESLKEWKSINDLITVCSEGI